MRGIAMGRTIRAGDSEADVAHLGLSRSSDSAGSLQRFPEALR